MLPRRMRLTRAGFEEAVKGARRATSPHFSVSIREAAPERGGLSAVVSKKVARRSVDRHLLKRRILAVLKDFYQPGWSAIVYARAGSPALPYSVLSKELQELLGRFSGNVR